MLICNTLNLILSLFVNAKKKEKNENRKKQVSLGSCYTESLYDFATFWNVYIF